MRYLTDPRLDQNMTQVARTNFTSNYRRYSRRLININGTPTIVSGIQVPISDYAYHNMFNNNSRYNIKCWQNIEPEFT